MSAPAQTPTPELDSAAPPLRPSRSFDSTPMPTDNRDLAQLLELTPIANGHPSLAQLLEMLEEEARREVQDSLPEHQPEVQQSTSREMEADYDSPASCQAQRDSCESISAPEIVGHATMQTQRDSCQSFSAPEGVGDVTLQPDKVLSTKAKTKAPPHLPTSPTSSALSRFVDDLLGSDFDIESPMESLCGESSSSTSKVRPKTPTSAEIENQIPEPTITGDRPCDRCKTRQLKCVRSSSTRRICDSCHSSHMACTRNGQRVSAIQPFQRPKSSKSKSHPAKATSLTTASNLGKRHSRSSPYVAKSSLQHDLRSSVNRREWTPDRPYRGKRPRTADPDNSDGVQVIIFNNQPETKHPSHARAQSHKPEKHRLASLPPRPQRSPAPKASPSASATALGSTLDTYTLSLLKDTKQALERIKPSLPSSAALISFEPTLLLFIESFASLRRASSHFALATILQYLQRIEDDCITPCNGHSNDVAAAWLAQALVDRTLSLITDFVSGN